MRSRRIRLLLTQAPGEAPLADALQRASDGSFTWGLKVPGDPIADTEHRRAMGEQPPGEDAFVDFEGEETQAVERLLTALGPSVDRTRSSALAGIHHLLMSRLGPYMAIFALQPRPDMTREAFFDYWFNVHGKFFIETTGGSGSYFQLHADEAPTQALSDQLGFGGPQYAGHAGGWLTHPEKIQGAFKTTGTLNALADERNFIDHSRSIYNVYRLAG